MPLPRLTILDPSTLKPVASIARAYESFRMTRRYWDVDDFQLVLKLTDIRWSLEVGQFLYVPSEGDALFIVEQASSQEGEDVEITLAGRTIEGRALEDRLVNPAGGEGPDTQTAVDAETAMRHYVYMHAGAGAAAKRQIPGLVLATNLNRGATVTVEGRRHTVAHMLHTIALESGLGWRIVFDRAAGEHVFEVVEGTDRSASVFLHVQQLESLDEQFSLIDSRTVAYVGGKGEGADRDVVTVWAAGDPEPEGFDRREAFVDGASAAEGDLAALEQIGRVFLGDNGPEASLEASLSSSGAFRYRTHWDVGDQVLMRGVLAPRQAMRVIEVEQTWTKDDADPTVKGTLDRPMPNMRERVTGSVGGWGR